MEVIHFRADEWKSGPVMIAASFVERWRGLRGAESEAAILLRTSSVHGVGMGRPFRAVGLSENYTVLDTRLVAQGRFARFRKCKWVLEIPADVRPPKPGQTLELVDD